MDELILILGIVIFVVGIRYQQLAKRSLKPEVEYSLIERFWYARIPPIDDLTERGREYARKAGIFGGVGISLVCVYLLIQVAWK
jgi:hypothetical protein